MMKILISAIWLFLFLKINVYWVWLWQLKECHWGRLRAHFESQRLRKIVFSFYGLRLPKLTAKIILIFAAVAVSGFSAGFFIFNLSGFLFYFLLFISLILAPLFSSFWVLLFQLPAKIFIKITLKKAENKLVEFPNLLVIGITGSYGKTSVKEFLGEILSKNFRVLKTEKHINAEIGIAKTILEKLRPEHQILIAEIGAYERGKIREVCQMLKPKIGILTGIGSQHLSTFGSLENIKKAKYELIESLPKNGIAIIYNKLKLTAENIIVEKEYVSFTVSSSGNDRADFKLNLSGAQNIINILLAASCAKELGMTLGEISTACRKIKPGQGGMKFLRKESPVVLDASYSANYDGVIADLEYLKLYEGKKIIVMPCLIELDGVAREIHKKIGRKIAEVCNMAIISTADYFKEIKQDSQKIILIENPTEIIKKLKEFSQQGDAILLEGRVPGKVVEFFEKK